MKIAVWHHSMFMGGKCPPNPIFSQKPITEDWSIPLMLDQMETCRSSGLTEAADEFLVCVNGGRESQLIARSCAPKKADFVDNGSEAQSILPTVRHLRDWCLTHKDWLVCFFHMKGVTRPHDDLTFSWRKCMERHVITNWKQCVRDIENGCDTVGAHWLTREKYGHHVTFPFWGGMFFWAKASFLSELPSLPERPTCYNDWFLPENWIGMGRTPNVKDYHPAWPSMSCG